MSQMGSAPESVFECSWVGDGRNERQTAGKISGDLRPAASKALPSPRETMSLAPPLRSVTAISEMISTGEVAAVVET